jgi:signal peptidase I
MTTEFAVQAPAAGAAAPKPRAGSNARLAGGFIGRTWLWFIGGCLVVTLLPLLFGWRPYVVESGSMAPRIKVGDVILAAPEHNPKKLLGHVTVFHDPDAARAGTIKSHRVVTINPDGTLTTKGDANPTVDSVHLQVSQVVGLGRLLVRWVGLPLIWAQTGAWLQLGLFAFSLWIGALLIMRDTDDKQPDTDPDVEDPGTGGPDAETDGPESDSDTDGQDADESTPTDRSRLRRALDRADPRKLIPARERLVPKMVRRTATAVVASLCLLLPTTQAAFAATTKDNSNSWTVGTYSYTTETKALSPYLYWKLDEANGTLANDSGTNNHDGTYAPNAAGWTKHVVGATIDDTTNLNFGVTATAAGAPATNPSCIYTAGNPGMATPGPKLYSEIVWFKTNSTTGGKLIGLENNRTGVSDSSAGGGQYDRMLYMDGAGVIWFGVWTGAATTIRSAAGLNDNNWHMATATMSTTTGMALYIDGNLVASSPNTVSETETATSFWRVGCGNLAGWGGSWTGPGAPVANTNYPFNGSLDEATVWLSTLTPTQIAFLYWTH